MKPHFDSSRALSWSSLSLFNLKPYGDKEKWYRRYVLGTKDPVNNEMIFGKKIADSFQSKTPLAPVTLYPVVEHKLEVKLDGIPLIGYIDTYDSDTHCFREFKTGKAAWTQKRANEHGQLKMYALMLYLLYKAKPGSYTIHLDWIPTEEGWDVPIQFISPIKIESFEVKITMADITKFASYIKRTAREMKAYVEAHE